MRKATALLLIFAVLLTLCACTAPEEPVETPLPEPTPAPEPLGTVYVCGPVPGHGWLALTGAYSEAKCAEISSQGEYTAVYMPAQNGSEQVSRCHEILANGDAALVIMTPLDEGVQAGLTALHDAGIPYACFGKAYPNALLNEEGDLRQCGEGMAYWLQTQGMQPGSTAILLRSEEDAVCVEGFSGYLENVLSYTDELTGDHSTTEVWTQEEVDAVLNTHSAGCGLSAEDALAFFSEQLPDIVTEAEENGGKLFIASMYDELLFGLIEYLKTAPAALRTQLEKLEIYAASVGGMQEYYALMSGGEGSDLADKYLDGMMSMYLSPKIVQGFIDRALERYASGFGQIGNVAGFCPTWIVDRENVLDFDGYQGHS